MVNSKTTPAMGMPKAATNIGEIPGILVRNSTVIDSDESVIA
jgi:hypothetical protein